ncbi:hypothetical protein [Oceanobacillus manasiensis]|uniref:hypothetical protein n=1 Tax=Oceanobacillus manasiensis TaxID=586413 RepID=UPI0005AB896C|nr:hypothetical protein [Oceanobacillus manasiensis]
MKLPNGITGFYDSKSEEPPRVDWKPFKQLCYDLALRYSGRVIDFNVAQYPTTFYFARLEIRDDSFYILLNQYYPYLAFASELNFENIEFIDRPDIQGQLSSFYQIIEERKLKEPFNQDVINQSKLNSAELEQIAYWKPATIGQVIFHYWD